MPEVAVRGELADLLKESGSKAGRCARGWLARVVLAAAILAAAEFRAPFERGQLLEWSIARYALPAGACAFSNPSGTARDRCRSADANIDSYPLRRSRYLPHPRRLMTWIAADARDEHPSCSRSCRNLDVSSITCMPSLPMSSSARRTDRRSGANLAAMSACGAEKTSVR